MGLLAVVGVSDLRALRASPVGPTDHADQLRDLRPLLHDEPTLFLGNDDFVIWELAGVPLATTIFGAEMGRPPPGEGLGHTACRSTSTGGRRHPQFLPLGHHHPRRGRQRPPPQMHLARATESFDLWRRVGKVEERRTLAEGGMPGAILDCRTPEGRAVLRGGGVAAVRPQPVDAGTLLPPGGTARWNSRCPQGVGSWSPLT